MEVVTLARAQLGQGRSLGPRERGLGWGVGRALPTIDAAVTVVVNGVGDGFSVDGRKRSPVGGRVRDAVGKMREYGREMLRLECGLHMAGTRRRRDDVMRRVVGSQGAHQRLTREHVDSSGCGDDPRFHDERQ